MTVLLAILIGSLSILLSRHIFKKWFNHLALYSLIWSVMVALYELKLIRYVPITLDTWVVIVYSFTTFLVGSIVVYLSRSALGKSNDIFDTSLSKRPDILADDGVTLKWIVIVFSIIGLLGAIQHWMILINEFGSIVGVLIRGNVIYRMRVEGELEGVVPYIFTSTFMALFLGGIYAGYKNRFSLFLLLPFVALVLKSLADVARAGLLLGFLIFFITFFLYRNYESMFKDKVIRSKRRIAISLIIVFIFSVLGATAVKALRSHSESYKANTNTLRELERDYLVSPSIYLYASSHIGVLDKYFESNSEQTMFGEVTFFTFYRMISKFEVIKEPGYYQKGYFIPMWTNTGTYLRDIHSDFGIWGIVFIPFFLGLISTVYWYRFYEQSRLIDFTILVFTYVIIAFSFLLMATRFGNWLLTLIFLLLILPSIERFVLKFKDAKVQTINSSRQLNV